MKELKVKEGGRPYVNEDFLILQELASSTTKILEMFDQPFVLSGLSFEMKTDDYFEDRDKAKKDDFVIPITTTFSEGLVYLDGKIRQVDACTIAGDSDKVFVIRPIEENGPDIVYKDGTSETQYINHKAKICLASSSDRGELTSAAHYVGEDGKNYMFPNFRQVMDKFDLLKSSSQQISDTPLILNRGLDIGSIEGMNGALRLQQDKEVSDRAYVMCDNEGRLNIASNGLGLMFEETGISVYSYMHDPKVPAEETIRSGSKNVLTAFDFEGIKTFILKASGSLQSDLAVIKSLTATEIITTKFGTDTGRMGNINCRDGATFISGDVYISSIDDQARTFGQLFDLIPKFYKIKDWMPVESVIDNEKIATLKCRFDGRNLILRGYVDGEDGEITMPREFTRTNGIGNSIIVEYYCTMLKIPDAIMAYINLTNSGCCEYNSQTRDMNLKSATAKLRSHIRSVQGNSVIIPDNTLDGYWGQKAVHAEFVLDQDGRLYISRLGHFLQSNDKLTNYAYAISEGNIEGYEQKLSNGQTIKSIFEKRVPLNFSSVLVPYSEIADVDDN